MLLSEEVLQPTILHFELCDASLKGSVLLGSFPNSTFEDLLALLLLLTEAGAGSGISTTTIFLCGTADALLLIEGGGDAIAGDGGAVLGVSHLAVGRGDG